MSIDDAKVKKARADGATLLDTVEEQGKVLRDGVWDFRDVRALAVIVGAAGGFLMSAGTLVLELLRYFEV